MMSVHFKFGKKNNHEDKSGRLTVWYRTKMQTNQKAMNSAYLISDQRICQTPQQVANSHVRIECLAWFV